MQDAFSVFFTKISLYPTLIFTGLVVFVTLYWLISILGMVDMETVDVGDIGDIGGDGDVSDALSSSTGLFTGVLLKFGLYGVPLVVIVTLVSLIGWVLSYIYTSFLHQTLNAGLLYYVFGTAAFLLVLVVSMWLTGVIISPIRRRFASMPKRDASSNIGKVAIVRTLSVTDKHGEAELSDGGAGLILKIRVDEASNIDLKRGDKVILTGYVDSVNAYKVVLDND